MKKRLLSVLLAMTLAVGLCACGTEDGASTETTSKTTTETTETADVSGRTSEDLYMDFLSGQEKVYAEKIDATYYDYDADDMLPYFDAKESYTVNDLMKRVITVLQMDYDLFLTNFDYSMIDCGLDGEPELALYTVFDAGYSENVELQFVIKNIDGKLQLCHMLESFYRSYSNLANVSGLITNYGSYGAASSVYGVRLIDANGDYKFVYDDEESYWAIYSLDERFEGLISEEELKYDELYISIYDFVEYNGDNWDELLEQRMYCAEYDPEMYYEGDEADNLAVLEPIFEKAGVKLYTREELNKAIEEREKEVGITAAMMDSDYMEWTPYEIDFNEINGIKEVTVSNVDELMNALDNRTSIILAPGEYNVTDWLDAQIRRSRVSSYYSYDVEADEFGTAEYYGEPQIFYSGIDNDPGLVLRGFSYCTMKSEDASNPATIVSNPRGENVVSFYDCTNLNFENIVFGHTDGNDECAGDVLYFGSCENVSMDGCDLYGCGATGLDLIECYTFNIDNTVIHDCSVGGVYVSDSYGISFANSTIKDIQDYGIISMSSGMLTFSQCTFSGTDSPMFSYWMEGYIDFYGCTFDQELKDEILSSELYGEYVNIYDFEPDYEY